MSYDDMEACRIELRYPGLYIGRGILPAGNGRYGRDVRLRFTQVPDFTFKEY